MYGSYYNGLSGYNGILLFAMLAVAVIGFAAQAKVQSTYNKYSRLRASSGLTAADVAQRLLYSGGSGAALTRVSGRLTDHYDPRNNTVGLSEAVYDESSVAALAVAAHEIGHVMQYQEGYGPIKLRNSILPVAQICSSVAPWLVVIGAIMGFGDLALVGAYLFGAILLFQLVTLPVELNASRRALDMLSSGGYISSADEEQGARRVLRAAAMTYVVAVLSALVSFLRLFLIARNSRRN